MLAPFDPFDPNLIVDDHEYRIYGDDLAQTWVVVDREDYLWAVQWKWKWKTSRGKRKFYMCRTLTYKNRFGTQSDTSLFLHVAIMKRTGIIPPSPKHTIVDHRNGDERDCRRPNLRWATPSMNRKNLYGMYPHDLMEG